MRHRRNAGQVIVLRQGGGFLKTLFKVSVALVFIMVIALIFFNCVGGGSIVQKIDGTLPSTSDAAYEIYTAGGIYYAVDARKHENGDVLMVGWYARMNGRWEWYGGEIVLPYSLYGEMTITRRAGD